MPLAQLRAAVANGALVALLLIPLVALGEDEPAEPVPVDLEDPPQPVPAFPPAPPDPLPYKWVTLEYERVEASGDAVLDTNGGTLGFSWPIEGRFLGVGSFSTATAEPNPNVRQGVRTQYVRGGVAYVFAAPHYIELSLQAKVVQAEFHFDGKSESDGGYELSAIAGRRLQEDFEARVFVDFLHLFERGATSVGASGIYNLGETWAAGLGYARGDGSDRFNAVLRARF